MPAKLRRIAVEEAFTIPEIIEASRRQQARSGRTGVAAGVTGGAFADILVDLSDKRIAGMDAAGIDVQLLLLSAPGVQIFDAATGTALSRLANDRLAQAIARHPTRLAGLAAVAPQDPQAAAEELRRAIGQLGLKGAVINSHTNGDYLDDPKFAPILSAAEALDVPIYIHPRDPSPTMASPLAIPNLTVGWGFGVETGTHALRLIGYGVFERHPRLRIVLGHMGEGIPYLLQRLDNRYSWEVNEFRRPRLPLLPSQYFGKHFVITTSGMHYPAPLMMAAKAELGIGSILFAVDYPFEDQAGVVRAMDGGTR